jgi:hypothetical protein
MATDFTFSLETDPRWRRFNEGSWKCPACNEPHAGIFDLACNNPDYWPEPGSKYEPNANLSRAGNFLSEDFCIVNGEHFFVRCVLELSILGTTETFGYGVWSSLSKTNFDIYVDRFDTGDYAECSPWFGWFSNNLKGYPDTSGLRCNVCPRADLQRPLISLHDIDHPLVREQQDGISFDRLLDVYALHGHDIRAGLEAS